MQMFWSSTQNKGAKTGILLVAALLIIPSQSFEQSSQEASLEKSDYVILLHGLARSYRSMDKVEELSELYKALSDPTRLRLVKLLAEHEGSLCVNALAHRLGVSQSAV